MNCNDGDLCTIDSCSDGSCTNPPKCPGQNCCIDGTCCAEVCDECIDIGTLSGGTIEVILNAPCVGDPITFTVSGVVDSGGQKRENCVVLPIPSVPPMYTWTLTIPGGYPPPLPELSGLGPVVSVEPKVGGTYSATFRATAERQCPPAPITIGPEIAVLPSYELDGDANHDGIIEAEGDDDLFENQADEWGVIVLNNVDDDDEDANIDNQGAEATTIDDGANGADADDFTELIIRPMTDLAAGWNVHLILEGVANATSGNGPGDVVRVFTHVVGGAAPTVILGPNAADGNPALFVLPESAANHDVDLAAVRVGPVSIWVEGLDFAAQVVLRMQIFDDTGAPRCNDTVKLKVAPFVFLDHLQGPVESYVSRIGESFAEDPVMVVAESTAYTTQRFPNATPVGVADTIIGDPLNGNVDRWPQDEFQIGFQESPLKSMYVVLDSKRDRELNAFPITLLGADFGHIQIDNGATANSLDSFGNLEVSPPAGLSYPLGRVYYGDGGLSGRQMDADLRSFLTRQAIQSPLTLESDWLFVGHTDEFISIVPSVDSTHGWSVLIADSALALDILSGDALVSGGVDAKLHVPHYADHGATQLGALLFRQTSDGSTTIAQYNAAGGTVATVLSELEERVVIELALESSGDIYHIPVLFDTIGPNGKARALTPDIVNGSSYGSVFIAPDPFLHASVEEDGNSNFVLDPGEDTNGNGMLDTLVDPFTAWLRSNVPVGLTVTYIDDWFLYHLQLGEVHCSSNERRATPVGPKWWAQAP